MFKHYHTDRLQLDLVRPEDAPFIRALLNTPGWLQFIGDRQVHSDEDARHYIEERMMPQATQLGFGNYVVRNEQQTPLGTCGIFVRDGLTVADLGFAFLPQYHGQGFATEAARCMVQAAGRDFGMEKLSAITLPSNRSSRRLLLRVGMQFVKMVQLPEENEVLEYYEMQVGGEDRCADRTFRLRLHCWNVLADC